MPTIFTNTNTTWNSWNISSPITTASMHYYTVNNTGNQMPLRPSREAGIAKLKITIDQLNLLIDGSSLFSIRVVRAAIANALVDLAQFRCVSTTPIWQQFAKDLGVSSATTSNWLWNRLPHPTLCKRILKWYVTEMEKDINAPIG